jgi:hypothetical protein
MVRLCAHGTNRVTEEEVEEKRMIAELENPDEMKRTKGCCGCGVMEGTLTNLYRDSEHHVELQFDIYDIQTNLKEVTEYMVFKL